MPLWKLNFEDDIDLLAGTNDELQELTNLLDNCATRNVTEIIVEKSKVMVNSNRYFNISKQHSLMEQTR